MRQRHAGPYPVDLPTLDPPREVHPGEEIDHEVLLAGFEPVDDPADDTDHHDQDNDEASDDGADEGPAGDAAEVTEVPVPLSEPAPVEAAPAADWPGQPPAAPVTFTAADVFPGGISTAEGV